MKFSEINFIKLIKSFTEKEILDFEKFINSPYFNTQNAVLLLFNELIKYYPEFEEKLLKKEEIFGRVFPKKEFNDTLLRKYISNLMKLAEDFLICRDVFGNEEKRMISLLDQYYNRNISHFFERQLAKIESKNLENPIITVETFYFKHFKEELKAGYYIKVNKIYEIKSCLIKSQIYILLQLLMTNTVYTNMMLIVQKSFKDSPDNDYFDRFNEYFDLIAYLEKIHDLSEEEKLFVSLCKLDYTFHRNPEDIESLKMMKDLIFKMSDILSDNLLYTFFSHINIYYLLNISGNNEELKRDLFENYKFMIEKGLYDREGNEFMNYSEYRTILIYSIRMKEYDWTEKFINKFKLYHEIEMRDSIVKYSQALLNYEKKNFDEALKLIASIKVNDVIMKLDVDTLLLLIYYDLDYIDSALSLIDSLRHYLSEIEYLSADAIKNHLNFLKFYRYIFMNKHNPSESKSVENVRFEIMKNTNLRRKDWLLEKLDSDIK